MRKLIYNNKDLVNIKENYREIFEVGTAVNIALCTNYDVSGYIQSIDESTVCLKDFRANSTMNIGIDRIREIKSINISKKTA